MDAMISAPAWLSLKKRALYEIIGGATDDTIAQ